MKEELICIICPNGCRLLIDKEEGVLKVWGAKCPRGIEFAKKETEHPQRGLCTTVKTKVPGYPLASVRTSKEIDKEMIFPVMKELRNFVLQRKVKIGDVLIKNILNTGVDIISTGEME